MKLIASYDMTRSAIDDFVDDNAMTLASALASDNTDRFSFPPCVSRDAAASCLGLTVGRPPRRRYPPRLPGHI